MAPSSDVWEKSKGNPVSETDLAVDALLKSRLGGLAPDIGWLSEETADNPDRLALPRLWLVDPIDGTKEFIAKNWFNIWFIFSDLKFYF